MFALLGQMREERDMLTIEEAIEEFKTLAEHQGTIEGVSILVTCDRSLISNVFAFKFYAYGDIYVHPVKGLHYLALACWITECALLDGTFRQAVAKHKARQAISRWKAKCARLSNLSGVEVIEC